MTFDLYPKLIGENTTEVLNEIVESRDDDIVTFDEMIRRSNSGNIFSTQAQGATAALQLGENDFHVDADVSGGAFTVTFEASPQNGQLHSVAKIDASGNAVTVSGNGKNINGSGTDSLSSQYNSKIYEFIGNSDEWRIIASV